MATKNIRDWMAAGLKDPTAATAARADLVAQFKQVNGERRAQEDVVTALRNEREADPSKQAELDAAQADYEAKMQRQNVLTSALYFIDVVQPQYEAHVQSLQQYSTDLDPVAAEVAEVAKP